MAALERRLAPLAFRHARGSRPSASVATATAPRPRAGWGRVGWMAAAAAVVATAVVWQTWTWRLAWPAGAPWAVEGGPPLTVGTPRTFDDAAAVTVARLGDLRASAGTTLTLQATGSRWHALALTQGVLDLRVWSPPGLVRVRTPAGEVIDLGCVFRVDVDPTGAARVSVASGWVQLDNPMGESLVPAGASSSMRAGAPPRVAVFDDAPAGLLAAVRGVEEASSEGDAQAAWARTVADRARPRDTFTLLTLAARTRGRVRAMLVTRAATLTPPPAGVSAIAVAAGDDGPLWAWVDALPLPPAKGWWRNWRDALPRAVQALP